MGITLEIIERFKSFFKFCNLKSLCTRKEFQRNRRATRRAKQKDNICLSV